jgi:hypothetical protein
MKPTTVPANSIGSHGEAEYLGWVAPGATDTVGPIPIEMDNDTGGNIPEASVVYVIGDEDGIDLATTGGAQVLGVTVADIDDAESGMVQFFGPVDSVKVTASVTAGEYAIPSATPGLADSSATWTEDAFAIFTTDGTDPEAFLFGGVTGAGTGGGGSTPEDVVDHGNMGATETLDMADGTWHRGTLDANCAITVTGFTVDEGLVCIFECSQDGTGGWDITWDADVEFIGDDQPDQTASTVTVFLLFSSAGDSTIYGVKVGASGSTSPLTTKGDLWGYDTADARVPVGTDGYLLVADSTDAQGVVWENPETTGHYEVLMDGASPPEPLENGSGTDWLYVFVP